MIDYIENDVPSAIELRDLYESVGWDRYAPTPQALHDGVANSTFVVTARDGEDLVGLARGLSDDVSIFYLQDILVRPTHQQRGVGKRLLRICLERFSHVRQKVLLTDDEERQHRLYRSVGYEDIEGLTEANLHAFVMLSPPS